MPNHPVDVVGIGATGNGPVCGEGSVRLVSAPVDPYRLDADNDGIGCET